MKLGNLNFLEWSFLRRAILRNFGSLTDMDPEQPFIDQFREDGIKLDLNRRDNWNGTGIILLLELTEMFIRGASVSGLANAC